jgi:hypothetical protein
MNVLEMQRERLGCGVQEDSKKAEIKAKEQYTHAKESQGLEYLAATKPVAQRVDSKSRLGKSASIERWGGGVEYKSRCASVEKQEQQRG